jgi:ribosomal protein S27E
MIAVRCPYCGSHQQVIDEAAGKEVACRNCFKAVRVPTSGGKEFDTAEVNVLVVRKVSGEPSDFSPSESGG